ncbi:MAG TPA: 2-hydroxyacid dehydrogenase [Devosia sp.]|nr:2-hydroxyacid dehydrogenase [Devosia sp.]
MPIEIVQTTKLLESCEKALAERYTVHKLHEAADPEALLKSVADRVRAVVSGPAPASVINALPKLEIVAHFGVGYDSVDTEAAKARGVAVTNTPDVLTNAVAELTVGMMLALARQIVVADKYIRDGKWKVTYGFPFAQELNGKTVGILGLGRIGKEIATRLQAMRMRVVYHGRRQQMDEPYVYYDNLVDMARDSDWLVIIAPGGKDTAKLVDRKVLEALGPEGYLMNIARGSLVDEPVLVEMLKSGALGGAALDVFASEPTVPEELYALDNVVLAPHIGSATQQTRDKMGQLVIDNLEAHFAGKPLISRVV